MKAIIFDIDGTLADIEHRRHHLPNWNKFFSEMDKDPVIKPISFLAQTLYRASTLVSRHAGEVQVFAVIIVSARPETYKLVTEEWLKQNAIPYTDLYMRKENDFRQDSLVKAEILEKILDDGYVPFLVVDDRTQVVEMWRDHGICTLQCAPDEIQPKHDGKTFFDIMVGPTGAGKSTYVSKHYKPHQVISTDTIRQEQGWGHSADDLNKTFNFVRSLIKARLENHVFTVLDATNLKKKDRIKILNVIPKGQYAQYLVIDRSLDDKLSSKDWRSEELVLKHHKIFKKELDNILSGDNQKNIVVKDLR